MRRGGFLRVWARTAVATGVPFGLLFSWSIARQGSDSFARVLWPGGLLGGVAFGALFGAVLAAVAPRDADAGPEAAVAPLEGGERRFEKKNALVRMKPWPSWLFVAPVAVAAFAALPWTQDRGLGVVLVFFALYFVAIVASSVAYGRVWRSRRMDVAASAAGIALAGVNVPRTAFRAARLLLMGAERTVVLLERRAHPIEIVVDSEAEGRALLEALRLDGRSVVAPFAFTAGSRRRALARAVAMPLVFACEMAAFYELPDRAGQAGVLLALALPAALVVVVYLLLGPWFTRIAVGADGLRIRHDLGRERFVPFDAVAEVEIDDGDGELTLLIDAMPPLVVSFGARGITRILFSTGGHELRGGAPLARAFARHVEEHRLAHGVAAAAGEVAALARGGRSPNAWLRDLRGLGEEHARYRVAALPEEALWRVVADPTSAASQRAGAAVVLGRSLDDRGRARLRVAAEACASPALRRALEAVAAANDEPSIARALDAVHDDAAASS